MRRAFASEWVKLWRPGQLLGTWGTMAGFALLLTTLLVLNASDTVTEPQQGDGPGGPTIPTGFLERSEGVVFAFEALGQFLGIIALVVAAANLTTEYTAGTLKILLVREPRRPVLLAGKMLAVASFVTLGIVFTLVVCIGLSAALATARGIATDAWWTQAGMVAVARALVNVVAAAWVWGLMGTMLAALFRTGFAAIGVGIAYPVVVESLLGLALPDVVKWMPGSVLGALAAGDPEAMGASVATIGHASAVALTLAYGAVFLAVPMLLIARRDVV